MDKKEIDAAIADYLKRCEIRIQVDVETMDHGSKYIYGKVQLVSPEGEELLTGTSEQYR